MKSPFQLSAPALTKRGYACIPVQPGVKACTLRGWDEYCANTPPRDLLKKWYITDGLNVGVTLGVASGIVALDYDYNVEGLHEVIQEIAGDYIVAKVGGKGYTSFYKYNGESSKKWIKNGETVIELLSTGRYTVVPPSHHPDGVDYKYITDKTLENTTADELPALPEDFVERVNTLFCKNEATDDTYPSFGNDLGFIEDCLKYINGDDYEVWVKVGMALKSADESGIGYKMWYDWSAKSPKFKQDEMLQKWAGFKKEGYTLGTIVYLAKAGGMETTKTLSYKSPRDDGDTILDTLLSWRRGSKPTGLSIGIEPLDKLFHWKERELTLLSGYPGSGKSEFTDHLIYQHFVTNNLKALMVSMEGGSVADHAERFIHKITGSKFQDRTEQLDIEVYNKIKDNLFFYETDKKSLNIVDILEYANSIPDLNMILIDPFNRLHSAHFGNISLHVNHVLVEVKQFCEYKNCMAMLVAHPRTTHSVDGILPRCNVYDIAGGKDFWAISDNVIMIHKDLDDPFSIEVELQKVKNQDHDSLGMFSMRFDKDRRIYEPTINTGF